MRRRKGVEQLSWMVDKWADNGNITGLRGRKKDTYGPSFKINTGH